MQDCHSVSNGTTSMANEENIILYRLNLLDGGVVQRLGRQSLAGGLSLTYAWSMVDTGWLRG